MMSNSWDHGSKMAFGATTGVGPLYAMNSSSSKKLLAIESSSAVPYRHLPSTATRNFSTMGLVGSVVRKIVNVLIPTEAQIQNLEKNRQSLSAPDILVDISISTPILETTRGIAKLRIPDDNETNSCDQTKSLSVGNSPFDWCPIASEMDKMDSDKQAAATCGRNKPRTRAKLTMPGSKFSYSDGCCSEILFKAHQQRSFTSAHGYKNSKTASKNRKQKNRRNQLVNMMEDVRSMTDDSESDFEADSPCSSLKDSQEKVSNCIRTTTTRSTEVSDKSVPLVCPLQLIDQTLQNASIINEEGFVIFAEDVQLTTPSVSPARRRDICAAINSFFVPSSDAPRRQRQISECSDDSIVFCYDSDDDSAAAAIVFQQDIDSDSDHESDSDDDTCDGESDATFSQQPDSGFEEKKVRFNPVPEVHVIRAWDFAYRQARKGDWEMAARDRERFRKRIEDTGRALSVVFEQKQRERIFRERFSS